MTIRTASSPYACPLEVELTCCTPLEDSFNSDDPSRVALAQRCLDSAWEILRALSGRQFGLCETTVRPCRLECCDPCDMVGPRWTPVLVGGEWTNVSCSSCRDACSCTEVCELHLPGPVDSIVQILWDGVVVPPATYRVDNRDSLVRVSGDCWPTCQDMVLPATEPGTFEITYMRGRPVPQAGIAALAELACELCKSCIGDKSCCLPARTKNVSRQGVSYDILDPMDFLKEGKTGVYMVDLWLHSVNPSGRPRRGAILSPDSLPVRRTTWQ